jgi:hypothetical protein
MEINFAGLTKMWKENSIFSKEQALLIWTSYLSLNTLMYEQFDTNPNICHSYHGYQCLYSGYYYLGVTIVMGSSWLSNCSTGR